MWVRIHSHKEHFYRMHSVLVAYEWNLNNSSLKCDLADPEGNFNFPEYTRNTGWNSFVSNVSCLHYIVSPVPTTCVAHAFGMSAI